MRGDAFDALGWFRIFVAGIAILIGVTLAVDCIYDFADDLARLLKGHCLVLHGLRFLRCACLRLLPMYPRIPVDIRGGNGTKVPIEESYNVLDIRRYPWETNCVKQHPTKTKEREKISMWFDLDVLTWLRAHQVASGVPIVEFVRRAVTDAIEKHKGKKK